MGIWTSGRIGGLSESFGLFVVDLGITADTALTAGLMLALKSSIMGLRVKGDDPAAERG